MNYNDLSRMCDYLEKLFEEHLVKQVMLKCNECDTEYDTEKGLKKHKLIHHLQCGIFKCETCELQFTEEWKYEGHIKLCENNSCDQCVKIFKSKNILKNTFK